nr:phage tail spike protein [Clostridium massiliodielmoense]
MIKIINIYDAKEIDFTHNGLAVLDKCIRCEVEEELNGFYGLELEYPIFDKKSNYLIKDNIVKANTPNGYQLFRIYRPVKNMGVVICYAKHIFYDLIDNFIESYRTGSVTGDTALKGILNNTQYPTNFSSSSNINEISDAFYVRKNPVEAILGENENSLISRWGGEILRDNFNISILNFIGTDKGVTISYGKNLLGLEEDLDNSEVVTRIMPTGLTENDSVIMLEEKYIDSPNLDKYPHPKIRHMHFGDIKVEPEKNITLADVKRRLREKVQELYRIQHIDIPKTNYKVDFVELSKTEEYKNYSCLESVNLGDIVTVKHLKMGINIRQKVIKYKWDSLLEKYLEIELGSFKESLEDDFTDLSNSIDEVKESLENTKKQFTSKIDQQDDRITLTVEEINKTNTKIEQTANSITLEVSNTRNNLNSKITQNADNISLVVDGGEINGNALVSAINMSDKKIGMRALNIDLDGYVTFRNLERGETTIDGGCIDCSTIDADKIGSRMSKVSDYVVIDGGRTASVNGIGTKQRGDGRGYLQLISSTGIILDAHNVVDADMNAFVTEDWVRQYVQEKLENWK